MLVVAGKTWFLDRMVWLIRRDERQEPRVEEIAHSILFLVDENIRFMTGNMLSVDGGWIAR